MKNIVSLCSLFIITPALGYYTENIQNACGEYHALVAMFEQGSTTCNPGYFLPANSTTCSTCPSGYTCAGGTFDWDTNKSQGLVKNNEYRTQNESKTCAANFPHALVAMFELAGYTCAAGQYLPANADACVACPTGYTCAGGAFDMDNIDQGLVANNISITWKNEDGTTLTTNTCTYGQPITIPANPTKTGYTFNGWTVVQ